MIYGYLRETREAALKAGIDKDTGLCRTGLDEYLREIFPSVNWVHDKPLNKEYLREKLKIRPDYLSEKLRMVVEFDGIQHYQKPNVILNDRKNTAIYNSLGYKVVRIPYFIQLSRRAVKILFDVDVGHELFDEEIPSLGVKEGGTPAFLCMAGVRRMAEDFVKFPTQYDVNIKALKAAKDDFLSGLSLLKKEMAKIKRRSLSSACASNR